MEEIEGELRELRTASRMAKILLAGSDQDTFKEALRVLCDALKSTTGALVCLDEEGRGFVPAATDEATVSFKGEHWEETWSRVFDSREFFLENAGTLSGQSGSGAHGGTIVMPVVIEAKTICAFHLAGNPGGYWADECALLKSLADTLAPVFFARFEMDRLRAEKNHIELSLRDTENLLQKVIQTMPIGVWITDKTGVIIHGNPAGQRIWQGARYVGPEEFHEYKAWWLKTGERVEPDQWAISRAIRNKEESLEEEVEIECFDGTHKVILNWAVPVLGADGCVESVVAVNQDITERKRMEMELAVQRDFSRNLIDTAQTIILVLNPDGTIQTFNPYMQELSGWKLEEVKGRDWFETFLPQSDWMEMRDLFREVATDLDVRDHVNPILTRDGRVRFINWYNKTLRDDKNNVQGILCIGYDVTERMKSEEEREKIIEDLRKSLEEIRTLRSIFPMCSYCKRIRNDEGYYEQLESYLHKHSAVDFSHTICPSCLQRHYPEEYEAMKKKNKI